MHLHLTSLLAFACLVAAQSGSSSGSRSSSASASNSASGSSSAAGTDLVPQTQTTNSYYTPEVTFTIPSGSSSFPGQGTAISGVGPSISTNQYTYTYNKPDATGSPTANPSLSSALVSSGIDIRSIASNLDPSPENLQDARGFAYALHVPTAVAAAAVIAAGAVLL
ncbi:hypothetical protein MCUN1_002571 [Malassezia cuniculi]|uniref:Uncharacterized protein n=1 Tax=Malassezia cuniculi TaxID=948313 RepID=A0AAF0ES54_9BASI|nr:hypothetical protein MCUN1_002571 [Malassezia cuniculi]